MQASISAAVVVVIFAFAFPKPADYSSKRDTYVAT